MHNAPGPVECGKGHRVTVGRFTAITRRTAQPTTFARARIAATRIDARRKSVPSEPPPPPPPSASSMLRVSMLRSAAPVRSMVMIKH